jgi:hypothetical protein
MDLLIRRWYEQHRTGEREAFDRMTHMKRPEFARQEAEKLLKEQKDQPLAGRKS